MKRYNILSVDDDELLKAGAWITGHLNRKTFEACVFGSFLCGYFHTFPISAKAIIADMEAKGFITKDGNTVTWTGK